MPLNWAYHQIPRTSLNIFLFRFSGLCSYILQTWHLFYIPVQNISSFLKKNCSTEAVPKADIWVKKKWVSFLWQFTLYLQNNFENCSKLRSASREKCEPLFRMHETYIFFSPIFPEGNLIHKLNIIFSLMKVWTEKCQKASFFKISHNKIGLCRRPYSETEHYQKLAQKTFMVDHS